MRIDVSKLPPRDAYHWLTHTIMPRPIAWVSTISAAGRTNLAPFSFFQGVTAAPPSLLFIPANNRDGSKKDTVRNLEEVPEFVVNTVSDALAVTMNATSASLPYGESEFEKFDVPSLPSDLIRPLRVAGASVSFECIVHKIVLVGSGPLAAHVVIGLIQAIHVDPEVLGSDGFPDPDKMDLVGRMGGEKYSRTRETFALKRP